MRNLKLLIAVLIMVAALIASLAAPLSAAPEAGTELTPTEDTYINRVSPGSNYNNGLLFLQQNLTGDFEADKVALIKFDLSSFAGPINRARLNLAVISGGVCGTSPSVSEINLYGAGDGWAEGTATWTSVGGFGLRGSLLDDMDENGYTAPAHIHFTDDANGNLAQYLEAQRTGDGVASFWVQIVGSGTAEVKIEDSEGSGAAAGCPGADLVPTLQVADEVGPLAITLRDFSADDNAVSPLIFAALGLGLVAVAGVVVLRRRSVAS